MTGNDFDIRGAGRASGGHGTARPRARTLLDDEQRAAFLTNWDAVQSGFATDPRHAAEAAEQVVAAVADSVVRRIGEITDALALPPADPSGASDGEGTAGAPVPEEETWRLRLLRCREAFRLLIDS